MKITKRLTFQLTPLLDLLLIVIFAQYMEVQEQTTQAEKAAEEKLASLDKTRDKNKDKIEDLENQLAQALEDLATERLASADTQATLRNEKNELESDLREVLKQQEQLANLVKELFKVPEKILGELGKPGQSPQSEAEIAELKKQFQELANKQAKDVIKHVIAHEELRKRCDIWEVAVDEKGVVTFNTNIGREGRVAGSFRFYTGTPREARTSVEAFLKFKENTIKTFSNQLYELYKSQPQPKSLVIVLFSFDLDIDDLAREIALSGLRRTVERMTIDSQGRSRFEYATIGFPSESTIE